MRSRTSFEELLAEGQAVPVDGWDFAWFDGRATEERPSWGYSAMLSARLAGASSAVDLQTGGGEVFAAALSRTDARLQVLAATESWPPNLGLARRNLAPFGARVHQVAADGGLPFGAASFDLVTSRHPTHRRWDEIARVLRVGGVYLSQGVGSRSNRELYEALMGPQPSDEVPRPRAEAAKAIAAGLDVVDLRTAATRVEFYDVAAVVHFLRKVVWTVPDFTVSRYRHQLSELHERICREGRFVCHSQRYLIEARRTE